MKFLDDLAHTMLDHEQLHFADGSGDPQSPEERWLLTLGAPLAAFNGDWLDSVASRRDEAGLREGTAQVWDVRDRASFERTAQWLRSEGQRTSYGAVWRGIVGMDELARSLHPLLRSVIDTVAPQFYEFKLGSRHGTKAVMAESGLTMVEVIEARQASRSWLPELRQQLGVEPATIKSLVAWDAVRLASLARWAVTLGYIERAEFSLFAGALAAAVRQSYASWSEVSAAYVAAGLIWKHSEAREESLLRTNAMLVADPRSPYRSVPFL